MTRDMTFLSPNGETADFLSRKVLTAGRSQGSVNDQMMGTITAPDDKSALSIGEATAMQRSASADRREDEREEREIFSRLEKPRVRYDVEVVTKIIVYAGKAPP